MDCPRTRAVVFLVFAITMLCAGQAFGGSDTSIGQENRCASIPQVGSVVGASWYGKKHHGRLMADGKQFNMYDRTIVAHKKLPLGTRLGLTSRETGRSIEVVVRDRGPYVFGRCFDLSFAAAEKLGLVNEGHFKLVVDYVVVPAPQGARVSHHSEDSIPFGG